MDKNIRIRKGNTDDLPAVYELVKELARYENEPDAVTSSLEDYQKAFTDGLIRTIVAEMDGKVVGMALVYIAFSTWKGRMMYLDDFVVNETYRRFGIGQKIYDALMLYAQEEECRLIKWQVLDWNEPAIKFYEKNKAVIDKEWWDCKVYFN